MTIALPKGGNRRSMSRVPLRTVLIVPFVIQIFAAVGLVGYLSFKNGQKATNRLANQPMSEVDERVDQHLDTYLRLPQQLNQLNANAVESQLDLQNVEETGRYFWKQMQVYDELSYIFYALPDGKYSGAGRWLEGASTTIDEIPLRTNDRNITYNDQARLVGVVASDLLLSNSRWPKLSRSDKHHRTPYLYADSDRISFDCGRYAD